MPVPKPKAGESESEFMDRCMGDSTMVKEYPQKQRWNVCNTAWEDSRSSSHESAHRSRELEILQSEIDLDLPG